MSPIDAHGRGATRRPVRRNRPCSVRRRCARNARAIALTFHSWKSWIEREEQLRNGRGYSNRSRDRLAASASDSQAVRMMPLSMRFPKKASEQLRYVGGECAASARVLNVRRRSGQSAWSDSTKPRSTLRWRCTPRIRIVPETNASENCPSRHPRRAARERRESTAGACAPRALDDRRRVEHPRLRRDRRRKGGMTPWTRTGRR